MTMDELWARLEALEVRIAEAERREAHRLAIITRVRICRIQESLRGK